jgi:dihydroxyacetone kinase DhaKLM complex PTS-EIIA-like component DhaM
MDGFDASPSKPPIERQLRHDELLLGGVLDLERQGFLGHWTTEAELKSLGLDAYRVEGSLTDAKYADAILYLAGIGSDNKVAVEMELTLKEKSRYRKIMSAYSFVRELRLLLFVVANPAIEAAIRAAADEVFFPKEATTLAFMELSDWKRNPAEALMETDDPRSTRRLPFAGWVAGRTQSHAG